MKTYVFFAFILGMTSSPPLGAAPVKAHRTMSELVASSKPTDWRELNPENTLYLELASGRVIIELAPQYAPNHVTNVKALAREKYWDGLDIVRSQDNYVVQWADPNAEKPELKRKVKGAKETLPAEFDRAIDSKASFTRLKDGDVYAKEVGYSDGFPVARDRKLNKTWLVHCYGAVGAGRDNSIDSGGGTELYAVTGHSPRQLDRNVTLLGRVVQGMELLSSLQRGKAALGFYTNPEQNVLIQSIHVASDIPLNERTRLEILRTDTPLFLQLIEARRNRKEEWFHIQAHHVEVCNVPIPVRTVGEKK